MGETPERCPAAVDMIESAKGIQHRSHNLPAGELTVAGLVADEYPLAPEVAASGVRAIDRLLDACRRCNSLTGEVERPAEECLVESLGGPYPT